MSDDLLDSVQVRSHIVCRSAAYKSEALHRPIRDPLVEAESSSHSGFPALFLAYLPGT